MDGFIVTLVICLIIEYKIVHNYAYKKGKKEADRNSKTEGYEMGVEDTKKDFYKMLSLPDEELMERIGKIREKS